MGSGQQFDGGPGIFFQLFKNFLLNYINFTDDHTIHIDVLMWSSKHWCGMKFLVGWALWNGNRYEPLWLITFFFSDLYILIIYVETKV